MTQPNLEITGEFRRKGAMHVNAICECGNKFIARKSHIKSGHIKSCGCYRRERMKKIARLGGLKTAQLRRDGLI